MQYDLIIIGGGLVGAGFACALRNTNLSIALIEAKEPNLSDPRLFALSDSSCQFLKNIDIFSSLNAHAAPIHQIHVSNKGHFGAVRLKRQDAGLNALGHVIPAKNIEVALHEQLATQTNVTVYCPATLSMLKQSDGLATLTIEKGDQQLILSSPLVIGADGAESTVRKLLQIDTQVFDYQQSAIVTRTILARYHHHIAYERFTSQGAIAMLPLIGNECATIWSGDKNFIAECMTLSEDNFLHQLQETFGYRLGRLQAIGQRYCFPLRMIRANKSHEGCVFLLGNAAHTLHPIAAQGFNLALYEVAAIVDHILKQARHQNVKQRILSAAELQQISEKIQQQQALSIGVSHRLSRLFAGDSSFLKLALPFGMMGFDIATPVKKHFIAGMMGKTRRIPRLLLSEH